MHTLSCTVDNVYGPYDLCPDRVTPGSHAENLCENDTCMCKNDTCMSSTELDMSPVGTDLGPVGQCLGRPARAVPVTDVAENLVAELYSEGVSSELQSLNDSVRVSEYLSILSISMMSRYLHAVQMLFLILN